MGIIEKAIGGAQANKALRGRTSLANRAPKFSRASGDSPAVTIATKCIRDHGIHSLNDDPMLSKEFRFLKRPVLAKIFGPEKSVDGHCNLIMVTSDLPGAGKSFVSFNLAESIAQEHLIDVVLIDADPVRRNLTSAMEQERREGLMEALSGDVGDVSSLVLATDLPGLHFLPAGQPRENATELLGSRSVRDVMSAFDDPDTVVILDSTPLLVASEAHALAEKVDHTIVVVESGRSTATQVESMLKALEGSPSSISFVLNKAPSSGGSQDTYYYSY